MNRSERVHWAHAEDNKMIRLFLFGRRGKSRLLDLAIEKIPMWELSLIVKKSGKYFSDLPGRGYHSFRIAP